MSDKTYKIIRLETENVKRISAVSITPEGNVIEITGKNDNGKSSVLDSIRWALGGKDDIQSMPIRSGQKSAEIVVHLDGLTVRRGLKASEEGGYLPTLVVEAEELGKISSPQKLLDKLLDKLTFDPLEFTKLKPAEQFELLKKFVPDFDFVSEAKTRKEAFDARTEVNRTIKGLKSQVAGISFPDDTPDEEIDVAALTDEIQAIADRNGDIERRRQNRERVTDDITHLRAECESIGMQIEQLQAQIAAAEQRKAEKEAQVSELSERLATAGALPELEDPAPVRTKIAESQAINANVRLRQQRDALIARVNAQDERSNDLTKQIEASDERKAQAIATAKMPVDGIGFGDGIVTLNGFPFDQASTAVQLRASVELAMAMNPKLRVLLIRDGAFLDSNSMKILSDLINERDYQCWIETVDSGRPGAVVIEDGMVKGASSREAAE
jgi:hypothetical protein